MKLKDENKISEFWKLAVESEQNILLVGGTGSGKTTVMKAMVDAYPIEKRLFTVEDVHELDLPNHPNHIHWMKPDHVLLAELRGDEAWTYLEMLNTGHQGSITTIHANDCRSAYSRLAGLVKQSEVGQTLDIQHILNVVKSSIDIIAFFKSTHLKELHYNPALKNKLLAE